MMSLSQSTSFLRGHLPSFLRKQESRANYLRIPAFAGMTACLLLAATSAHAAEPKNYPLDVRKTFMTSCVGVHKEMIKPCTCMIKQFQLTMPLEEFATFASQPNVAEDKRFTTVANNCIEGK